MKVKEKLFKYDKHYVCKADHEALNEIDNKLGALLDRMEASVDMLNNELLEENHKKPKYCLILFGRKYKMKKKINFSKNHKDYLRKYKLKKWLILLTQFSILVVLLLYFKKFYCYIFSITSIIL